VCSHSARDMAAVYSIESDLDHKNAEHERLCSCEQLSVFVSPRIANRGKSGDATAGESTTSRLTWENSDGNFSYHCAAV
jgi:hypothetical protein